MRRNVPPQVMGWSGRHPCGRDYHEDEAWQTVRPDRPDVYSGKRVALGFPHIPFVGNAASQTRIRRSALVAPSAFVNDLQRVAIHSSLEPISYAGGELMLLT